MQTYRSYSRVTVAPCGECTAGDADIITVLAYALQSFFCFQYDSSIPFVLATASQPCVQLTSTQSILPLVRAKKACVNKKCEPGNSHD